MAGCSEAVLGCQPGWAWQGRVFIGRGFTFTQAEGREEGHGITGQRETKTASGVGVRGAPK